MSLMFILGRESLSLSPWHLAGAVMGFWKVYVASGNLAMFFFALRLLRLS
jgi:hypothetical protein